MSGDSALLDLFRAEAEAHMKTLSDGLLELEQDGSRSQWYEPLMRAAHSIKGAAKIVGLDAAVPLAHAVEDYFVAARDGRVIITSAAVDVLLAGLDALQQLTQLDTTPDAELGRATAERIGQLAAGGREAAEPPRAAKQPVAASSPATDVAAFSVPAALDASWAEAHTDHVRAALDSAALAIRLDLSSCESIEPAGLAWLLRVARTAARSGAPTTLALRGAAPQLERLLSATGLVRSWKLDRELSP
jgi:two-component system sensor histidine kinase and response regulator WspE